ncbi:MAG: formylglycine-generating enzyme family protein [Nitrospirota bacterium]
MSIKEWERSHRSADLLLRGRPLTEAGEWLTKKPDAFSPGECQFIRASQNRKIKARALVAVGSILVLLLIGGPIAWLGMTGVTVSDAWLIVQARLGLVDIREPDMVEIAGGEFQMGDVEGLGDQTEQPVRTVRIAPFQLSQYEVTFDAYDQFVKLKGSLRRPDDYTWWRGRRPVIDVSWEDAQAYARWLSQVTGKSYRLPREAEWEYASRSGDKKQTWSGTFDESQLGEFAVYEANSGNRTAEVGEDKGRKHNDFGLYDMSGNVGEWVEDCWHENYTAAPKDGSAWLQGEGGDCGQRVVRGGSWNFLPVLLRASTRIRGPADSRNNYVGFRLARGTP